MSERRIEHGVAVYKSYCNITYDQYGNFKGTYNVIVRSDIGGDIGGVLDTAELQEWCSKELETIKEFTE